MSNQDEVLASELGLKLTYFPVHGRGEVIRLLLSYGNIPFEDKRITFDDFPKLKKDLVFKRVPQLDVTGEGVALAETLPILKYVSSLSGLDTDLSALKAAQIDMVNSTIYEDVVNPTQYPIYFEEGETQAEHLTSHVKNRMAKSLEGLEAIASATDGSFLFGDDVTSADLSLFAALGLGMVEAIPAFSWSEYPTLKKVVRNVSQLSPVQSFVKTRKTQPWNSITSNTVAA